MSKVNEADLKLRFGFHAPSDAPNPENVADAHERVRGNCLAVADKLVSLTPAGREQAVMLTKLEEVMFWGNAAIARNHQAASLPPGPRGEV